MPQLNIRDRTFLTTRGSKILSDVVGQTPEITRKKSFQIILPSDVIIALRGTHGSRGIAETAYLFWFPRGATKCQLVTTTRRRELHCSLVNCLRWRKAVKMGLSGCVPFTDCMVFCGGLCQGLTVCEGNNIFQNNKR